MKLIKFPVATEKAVRLIESDNAITFVVDRKANKPAIKKELETEFKIKINSIRVMFDTKGRKKAIVSLAKDTPAMDIATQLGIM